MKLSIISQIFTDILIFWLYFPTHININSLNETVKIRQLLGTKCFIPGTDYALNCKNKYVRIVWDLVTMRKNWNFNTSSSQVVDFWDRFARQLIFCDWEMQKKTFFLRWARTYFCMGVDPKLFIHGGRLVPLWVVLWTTPLFAPLSISSEVRFAYEKDGGG